MFSITVKLSEYVSGLKSIFGQPWHFNEFSALLSVAKLFSDSRRVDWYNWLCQNLKQNFVSFRGFHFNLRKIQIGAL
jgi:hypothetical protein